MTLPIHSIPEFPDVVLGCTHAAGTRNLVETGAEVVYLNQDRQAD